MSEQTDQKPCPHCGLPPVLPDVCTPELNEVIEAAIAADWALYNAGWDAGRRAATEEGQAK